ncbi:hypothetical protein [Alkalihalobacterium chitinilyticum]|uniref:Uncharacterized protein n=1 Tax=Alkalihalobacterium chitinilyticum TaxID=2980103 RepID=A0ABT5VF12_9BACI|nr:hypothetical protein [Alkalihalobacterium chitinilyticum]MDE5414049.1 hypothetical protein [Alkalihalobacterium chitinilyticum]
MDIELIDRNIIGEAGKYLSMIEKELFLWTIGSPLLKVRLSVAQLRH